MKPAYEPDLLDPGVEGAPLPASRRQEIVNLTRRCLLAEASLANSCLKERELLLLADRLEATESGALDAVAAEIRSILKLPE